MTGIPAVGVDPPLVAQPIEGDLREAFQPVATHRERLRADIAAIDAM
jgi:hypothetical protein